MTNPPLKVTMTSNQALLMQKPRLSEFGSPVYYWCDNRQVPSKGFTFDDWSKEPNYWTGWMFFHKGVDYLRLLHTAAVERAEAEGWNLNEKLAGILQLPESDQ